MYKCPKCRLLVYWAMDALKNHKQCYNPDGSIHWDTCSQARTAYAKRHGVQFGNKKRDHGLEVDTRRVHKTYMMQERSKVITGKYYKPSNDTSCPFEVDYESH